MKFFRLVFIFAVSLGNVLFLKDISLSFFLFNLFLFGCLFFPYFLFIRTVSQFFIFPCILAIVGYMFLTGISFLEKSEFSKNNTTHQITRNVKQAYHVKDKKISIATLNLRKKQEKYYRELLIKPSYTSFKKNPELWYKEYIKRLYSFALGVHRHNFYGLYSIVFFVFIYTIILFSSPYILSAIYAFVAFLFLPSIFFQLHRFFLYEEVKYQIICYTFLCTVVLIGYVKTQKTLKV